MSMMDKLPHYYRKSEVVKELYRVIKMLFDKLSSDADIEDKRLFIITTDDFTKHESDVGLQPIEDTPENRRSRVLARLQGNNLFTLAELETLVNNYEKSGCSIQEDFENYTVQVIFSNMKGVPDNLEQLKAAVNEVKPAHIKIEFVICENTWQEVFDKFGYWGNIDSSTTWEMLMYHDKSFIYLDDNNIPYRKSEVNAQVYFTNGKAYARRLT